MQEVSLNHFELQHPHCRLNLTAFDTITPTKIHFILYMHVNCAYGANW